MYMFCAICKFTQLRNCAAQIRNPKLQTNFGRGIRFRNCVAQFGNFGIEGGETCVPMTSAGDANINYLWQHSGAFCKECCANRNDKMILKDKGQKIVRLLKNNPVAVNCSWQFKFLVKKRGFQLTSYSPFGLKDVPCLPASVSPP